nr:putative disease resistance RPP13-like protein 3 [Ipomoea batatas]
MAFAAVTILMDTLHQHFLQPTPRFPLRNKTKVKLLYKHLSSLQTSLEQDFKVGECDEAIKALEAQMRDVSIELRFQIEHELRLFYLGKSMKLRLHSAKKLLPILSRAKEDIETIYRDLNEDDIETMDLESFVLRMVESMDFDEDIETDLESLVVKLAGKHVTLPVSKKLRLRWAQEFFHTLNGVVKGGDLKYVMEMLWKHFTLPGRGDEWESEDEQETEEETEDEQETEEETEDEQETEEETDDKWESKEEQKNNDEQRSKDEQETKEETKDEWENKEEQKRLPPHNDVYASMEFMGLVHLRYLKSHATLKLHSLPLFMLWNLQKLDFDGVWPQNEPLNIWGLPQLKTLTLGKSIRLVPPRSVHHNLESIIYLDHRSCTEELFMRIPNLRTLGVMAGCKINLKRKAFNWFESLACLYKLEDLLLHGKLLHPKFSTLRFTGTLNVEDFLPNLKRLKLIATRLNWKNMYIVEMLPKLEVLILGKNAAVGGKWKPTDRGFPGLKFLIIDYCDLHIWKATGDHFPVLESISSAKCIRKEKLDYGNDAFTVDILWDDDFDDMIRYGSKDYFPLVENA